jgi:GR25 family glycosyltransferase involved in LPS biosynthesis
MNVKPCDKIMHLNITDLYPKDFRVNGFCTLKNGFKNQSYFGSKGGCSSSSRNGQRVFELYYNKFIYDCAYCCVLVVLDGASEKHSPRVGTLVTGKTTIHNQTISEANCLLQRQLTLKEIGIKKIFLVNLDRRIDRLSHALRMLGYLKLPSTRFSAIDARKMREERKKFDSRTKFIRNISSLNKGNARTATWQSHLQILFKIVNESKVNDTPVLILEDDFDMEVNAPSLLKETLNILPSDWEMFLLGHSHMKCKQVYENNICRATFFYCTFAYIIRNSTVAGKLINWSNTETAQVADVYWLNYIKNDSLVVYGAYPNPIAIQDRDKFGSDIPSGPLTAMKLQNPLSKMIK